MKQIISSRPLVYILHKRKYAWVHLDLDPIYHKLTQCGHDRIEKLLRENKDLVRDARGFGKGNTLTRIHTRKEDAEGIARQLLDIVLRHESVIDVGLEAERPWLAMGRCPDDQQ